MVNNKLHKEYNLEQLLEDGDLDTLYMCCENLIFATYKRFPNVSLPTEDKYELGYLAFMEAVKTFNAEKNTKFSTLLGYILTNDILQFYRKYQTRAKYSELSLDTLTSSLSAETDDKKLSDILPAKDNTEEQVLSDNTSKSIHEYLKSHMTIRQYSVLTRYLETESAIQTAREFGVVPSYVNKIKRRAQEELRKYYKINLKMR